MSNIQPSIPGFYGRAQERAWLRGLFDEVADVDHETGRSRGGPKLAVIVANTGLGKSRLVQTLYQELTVDSKWDPEEANYWPDAFQDAGKSLRVNPDFKNHEPNGPPQFIWMGARWADPKDRNRDDRVCPLPDCLHEMEVHVDLARKMGTAWSQAIASGRDAIGGLGLKAYLGATAELVDLVLPGAAIAVAAAAKGKKMLDAHSAMEGGHEAEATRRHANVGQRWIEVLSKLMRGKHPMPVVLWFDDAQWIDEVSCVFLTELMYVAKAKAWPLLVVATHWETEWRENLQEQMPKSQCLAAWRDDAVTEVRELKNAEPEAMGDLLAAELPGLSGEQRSLLLEKAGGNYLSMVENFGQLKTELRYYFKNGDTALALTPKAETEVETWSLERESRVKQMFGALAPDVKVILGWSSHIGHRFIAEVIESFAEKKGKPIPGEHLKDCVDPLAILGEPNPYIREFRDRAFYEASIKYFGKFLLDDDDDALSEALRTHLVEWINASFDDEGDLKAGPDDEVAGDDVNITPARSVKALEPAERMDMLRMAVLWLPIPESPDWTCPRDQASLRAVVWLTGRAASEGLWDRCRVEGRRLKEIDWALVPYSVVSILYRRFKAEQLETAGANSIAYNLWESLLAGYELPTSDGTPESRRDVSVALGRLANLDVAAGDHAAAKEKFERCLEIREELAASLGTPDSRRDVSVALGCLADRDVAAGDHAAARKKQERCLKIRVELADSLGTPGSRRDVSVALGRLANLDVAAEDHAAARKKQEQCLEIREKLAASLGTPGSRRDVSVALGRLADLDVAAEDHAAARKKQEQCLEIREKLAASLGTPESRRDVSVALGRLAGLDVTAGDPAAARAKYEQCLEIREELAASLGTPGSRRDVSVTLARLADLDMSDEDYAAAKVKLKRCLEINEELAALLGTPESRRDVSVTLERLANLDKLQGEIE